MKGTFSRKVAIISAWHFVLGAVLIVWFFVVLFRNHPDEVHGASGPLRTPTAADLVFEKALSTAIPVAWDPLSFLALRYDTFPPWVYLLAPSNSLLWGLGIWCLKSGIGWIKA